ncbi:hypothetical protein GCM10027449_33080 [Sinomonas notoginsengisoli]|uniref:ROK family protein n=1 Tax=Sinomonas notoginsengisoli TaxID=1457311 RepID=UPI001F36DEDD|nr:ROK family protein [Sinomonas notoginsengisoli]
MKRDTLAVGYAVTHEYLYVSSVMPDGLLKAKERLKIPGDLQTPDQIVDMIADHVTSSFDDSPSAIGVSVGGHVEHAKGLVRYAPDLAPHGRHWKNVDVSSQLQDRTGLPNYVDNDVNCMVSDLLTTEGLAGVNDLVVIYIAEEGHGLGSALVAGGEIVRGSSGGAGEFGHVTIQPAGARCRCGSRGCLEALLSVETLAREINWGGRHGVSTMAEAASLVEGGVVVAQTAFRRAGRNFGQGLAVLVNLLNPERILVGGPGPYFSEVDWPSANELFQAEFEAAVADYSFSDLQDGCKVDVVQLGPETAASGAARMALSREGV